MVNDYSAWKADFKTNSNRAGAVLKAHLLLEHTPLLKARVQFFNPAATVHRGVAHRGTLATETPKPETYQPRAGTGACNCHLLKP